MFASRVEDRDLLPSLRLFLQLRVVAETVHHLHLRFGVRAQLPNAPDWGRLLARFRWLRRCRLRLRLRRASLFLRYRGGRQRKRRRSSSFTRGLKLADMLCVCVCAFQKKKVNNAIPNQTVKMVITSHLKRHFRHCASGDCGRVCEKVSNEGQKITEQIHT